VAAAVGAARGADATLAAGPSSRKGGGEGGSPRRRAARIGAVASRPSLPREGRRERNGRETEGEAHEEDILPSNQSQVDARYATVPPTNHTWTRGMLQ
jgi:hypothetical protein